MKTINDLKDLTPEEWEELHKKYGPRFKQLKQDVTAAGISMLNAKDLFGIWYLYNEVVSILLLHIDLFPGDDVTVDLGDRDHTIQ